MGLLDENSRQLPASVASSSLPVVGVRGCSHKRGQGPHFNPFLGVSHEILQVIRPKIAAGWVPSLPNPELKLHPFTNILSNGRSKAGRPNN